MVKAVLVIDDDETTIFTLTRGLAKKHYVTRFAFNGKDGIDSVNKNPPDMVLLDINMPGMTGFDVISSLQSNDKTKSIPVVAISSAISHKEIARFKQAGFTNYLHKPIHLEDLIKIIKQYG